MNDLGRAVVAHKDIVEFYRLAQKGVRKAEDSIIKVVRIPVGQSSASDTVDIAMYADDIEETTLPQIFYDVGVWRHGNTIAASGALSSIPSLLSSIALKGENGHQDVLLKLDVDSLAGLPGEPGTFAFLPLDNEDAYRWAQRAQVSPEATTLRLGEMSLYAFDVSRMDDTQLRELRAKCSRILMDARSRAPRSIIECDDDTCSQFTP